MEEKKSKLPERYEKVLETLRTQRVISDYSFLDTRVGEFARELADVLQGGREFGAFEFYRFCYEFFLDEGVWDEEVLEKVFTREFNDEVERALQQMRELNAVLDNDGKIENIRNRAAYLAGHFCAMVRIAVMDVGEAGYPIADARNDVEKNCKKMLSVIEGGGSGSSEGK